MNRTLHTSNLTILKTQTRLVAAVFLATTFSVAIPSTAFAQVTAPGGSSVASPSGGSSDQGFSSTTQSTPFSSPAAQGSSSSGSSVQINAGSTLPSNGGTNAATGAAASTGSNPTATSSTPNSSTQPATNPDGTVPMQTPSMEGIGGSMMPLFSPATSENPKKSPAAGVDFDDAGTKNTPPTAVTPTGDVPPLEALPLAPAEPVELRATLHKKRNLVISLTDACRLSEGKNITLRIAQENQKIQQSDYLLRLSNLLPDITAQYTQSRLVGSVQVFGGQTSDVTRNTFQPQLTMNYTIYTGGRNIFDIQASKHRLEALKGQTESTRQDMLRQISLAYYDMQAAYWQRSLSQQSLREAAQQVALNRARFNEGIGLEVDALQAESNQSLRRQELVQAEVSVSQASEALAQLLNLDFEVELLPDTLDAIMFRRVPDSLSVPQLMTIATKNNPNLEKLAELARAGKSDVNTAVADLFPQINLSTYRNRTGPNVNDALPTRYTGVQATWNLAENMGFAQPLAIRQAKSNMRVAEANLEQGKRLLQQNVVNTYISIQALSQTVQAAWDNLRATQAAYAQAKGRLQEGVGTNVELQLALTQLATARSNLANAFFNYNRLEIGQLFNLGVVSTDTIAKGYKP